MRNGVTGLGTSAACTAASSHCWVPRKASGSGGWGSNANVTVTLTVPLYAGGAIQNRLRETEALQEKARTDAEGARNSATLGTRTAFLSAQSLNAQVKALQASEASSKLALDATRRAAEMGSLKN